MREKVHFAAKGPSHPGLLYPHRGKRQIQGLRQLGSFNKGPHRGSPDIELAGRFKAGQCDLRLQISVGSQMALKPVLADIIRLGKSIFNVAPLRLCFAGDINEGLLYFWMGGMYFRGPGLHGRCGIKNGGQRFIINPDEAQGFFGDIGIRGGYRCYLFAHKAHPICCQRVLVRRISRGFHEPMLYTGCIPGGDHRFNPIQLFGTRGVNIENPCMGMRAAQNTTDQHTGQMDVSGIFSPAGHFFRPVLAGNPLPNVG